MPGESEKEYQDWLVDSGMSKQGSIGYVRSIRILNEYIQEKGYCTESIYEIENVDQLINLYEMLKDDNQIKIKNRNAITAFRKYILYWSNGAIQLGVGKGNARGGSKRKDYQNWLKTLGMTKNGVKSYGRTLSNLDDYIQEKGYCTESIYEIEDVDQLITLYGMLNADKQVKAKNRSGLSSFKKYIAYRSNGSIQLTKSVKEYEYNPIRERFQNWLKENGMTEAACKNYGRWIFGIDEYIQEKGYYKDSLYEIDDIEQLVGIYELLKNDEEIRRRNKNAITGIKKLITFRSNGAIQLGKEKKPSKGSTPRKEYQDWLKETGMKKAPATNYGRWLGNLDAYIQERGYCTESIYEIEDADRLVDLYEILQADKQLSSEHRSYLTSFRKYVYYRSNGATWLGTIKKTTKQRKKKLETPIELKHSKNDLIDFEEQVRIRKTLELPRFEYGFKDDDVELYRFRESYKDINGIECALENSQLLDSIHGMGFEYEGKTYLISQGVKESICDKLKSYKEQGLNIVYYESLYDLNYDDFFDAKIMSAEMLKSLLKESVQEYKYRNSYLALNTDLVTELDLIQEDILRVWGQSTVQSVDELSFKLPLIPVDRIKVTLSQRNEFVWNSAGIYTRADLFIVDEQEIKLLTDYIEEQCDENGRVSIDDLPLDNMKALNPEFSDTAFETCFCRLIPNYYERNARILTRKGDSVDIYSAVFEYCQKQEKCTLDRLTNISLAVAGIIKQPEIIEAANAAMVRIDKDTFIANGLIHFDADRIDRALDNIVTDDFIGMKEIITFSTFPYCGVGWNLYLLESYCRRFSKKYRYDTRRANSSNSGAIISKQCDLNYHDIMAHAVARSGRELSSDAVFDYLTETGYMERKRYSEIDLLIDQAAQLRERRK